MAFQPTYRAAPCLQLDPCAQKFLRRYRLRNIVKERGKFRFSASFSFGDIKATISHLVQWHCRHLACLTTIRVKSLKTWRQTARNAHSNRELGARSRNLKSKPEPEVVLAAILHSKGAICRVSGRRRWRNVEIAVPRDRASTEVQYGVPAPDRK